MATPCLDPDRRARLDWASMARREVRFYRDLAHRLDLVVPDVFVARFGGFTAREFFELTDEAQRAVPEVDFGTDDQ